jgi:type II secretory pathway pseudopilin PulG
MDTRHEQLTAALKESGRPAHTAPVQGDAPAAPPMKGARASLACGMRSLFPQARPWHPLAPATSSTPFVIIPSSHPAGETPALPPSAPPLSPISYRSPVESCAFYSARLLSSKRRAAAFTLIESVVAIGIFAFVIVGIVGLFGSTLERQRQASFETRAVMVSQQILARIRAAESATNVFFTRGSNPTNDDKLFHSGNMTASPASSIEFYYKKDGTEISGLTPAGNYESGNYAVFSGYDPDGSPEDIVGRARAILTTNGTGLSNLYRVAIEVSEPANLPIEARRYTNTFTTFATFPN